MNVDKKEIYGSRAGAAGGPSENQNGDKWGESLQSVFELALENQGPERTAKLLEKLAGQLRAAPRPSAGATTPYVNTIPVEQQPAYPGDRDIERRIKSIIRWNAMAMVVKANSTTNVGGHISTFASSATLYEVAQNHFFRGRTDGFSRRHRLFSGPRRAGHVCAGVSRRPAGRKAFAEFPAGTRRGRRAVVVSASVSDAGFLAVPDGLDGPRPDHVAVSGAVQPLPAGARPGELEGRAEGLGVPRRRRIRRAWTRSAPSRSRARENLDNFIWVINCNLQRLDGPVRGNGKIIQELEGLFRGAGWNVIKVIWGTRLGRYHSRATNPACCSSAWRNAWTAITRNISSSRAATRANISSANIPNCSNW